MNRWIVFDGNNMPKRTINMRHVISDSARYPNPGEAMSIAKRRLTMSIAEKIAENGDLFHIEEDPATRTVSVLGSCVVLTADEYAREMQDQFLRGRDCGMGMYDTKLGGK